MKKIIIALILLISFSGHSQDAAKAKALLNEVNAKVKGYSNISIDFKYVLKNISENINGNTW